MTFLIGIDEAGYGPNLGPLCVGVSVWKVTKAKDGGRKADRRDSLASTATSNLPPDLYQLLSNIVSPAPTPERIAIADSKQLYKPGQGLTHLERGVLTALAAVGRPAADWQSLFTPPKLPWYEAYDCPLPVDADEDELAELASSFSSTCESAGVRLVDLRVRLVYPQEFNELTEHYGSKGAALSHVSIELLKTALANLPPSTVRPPSSLNITCDKHGGRNRYAALLQHHFPDEWIETLEESRPQSRYRWGPPEAPADICFRTKGEAMLPVALASMAAKYHRELAMRAFNAYWTSQVPGLKTTAGYPQDAKRFKSDIATVQSKLSIDDRVLWRNR